MDEKRVVVECPDCGRQLEVILERGEYSAWCLCGALVEGTPQTVYKPS